MMMVRLIVYEQLGCPTSINLILPKSLRRQRHLILRLCLLLSDSIHCGLLLLLVLLQLLIMLL